MKALLKVFIVVLVGLLTSCEQAPQTEKTWLVDIDHYYFMNQKIVMLRYAYIDKAEAIVQDIKGQPNPNVELVQKLDSEKVPSLMLN